MEEDKVTVDVVLALNKQSFGESSRTKEIRNGKSPSYIS